MKNFFNFQNLNLKGRRDQLLILLFLLIILFPLVYLTQKEVRRRIRGAELAKLSLFPADLVKVPEEGWKFPFDQDIKVNLMLATGDHEVETVEAIFYYNPEIISAREINFNTSTLFPLKNTIVKSIKKDGDGNETGTIHIVRTAIPLPPYDDPDQLPSYDLVPAHVEGVVATISFHTLKVTGSTTYLTFAFTPEDNPNTPECEPSNDSNVTKYPSIPETSCPNANDVLGQVVDVTYFVAVEPTPTLTSTPSLTSTPIPTAMPTLIPTSTPTVAPPIPTPTPTLTPVPTLVPPTDILVPTVASSPQQTAILVTTPEFKKGDINQDDKVDIFDLSRLLSKWSKTDDIKSVDLNNDGKVDIFDLSILLSNWGQ